MKWRARGTFVAEVDDLYRIGRTLWLGGRTQRRMRIALVERAQSASTAVLPPRKDLGIQHLARSVVTLAASRLSEMKLRCEPCSHTSSIRCR